MKKLICATMLFIGLLGTTNLLLAQEAAAKQKLVILPLANQVDTNKFFSSDAENAGLVTFLTIYDFMRNLPFADVTDRNVLQQIPNANPDLEAIASKYGADLIIYGDYHFTGDPSNPTAVMAVKIWSAEVKQEIFNKTYQTATDIEILDTIDQIIKDAIQGSFNIETKMARVRFSDFKINPKDRYRLLVNDKEVARVTNQNFSYSIKVLANTPYHFKLIRGSNNNVVMDFPLTLQAGEHTNLSYSGRASVEIKRIKGKAWGKHYQVLFDGQEVAEKTILSNLPVNVDHRVVLLEDKTNTIQTLQLSLLDGEKRGLTLGKARRQLLHYRAYTLGSSFGGFGLDIFLDNSLWAGLNLGMSFYDLNVFIPAATLNLSYYLVGDNTASSLRVGAGITGGGYYALPLANVYAVHNYDFFVGVSTVVEWQFIYARVAVVHCFNTSDLISFIPEIGIKF